MQSCRNFNISILIFLIFCKLAHLCIPTQYVEPTTTTTTTTPTTWTTTTTIPTTSTTTTTIPITTTTTTTVPTTTTTTTAAPTTTCPTTTPCPVKNCVPSCDQGWTYFSPTDKCYRVYHNAKWNDAEAACVALSGHLASVHSANENTFINTLASTGFTSLAAEDLTWIGLHLVASVWQWTDGTPADYLNWAPTQPDRLGREFCVQTVSDDPQYAWYEKWNNIDCNTDMRAYVCQKASIHA